MAKSAKADKRAADLAPVIADIQAMGATTCAAIAAELNERGFPTPRGGRWASAQAFLLLKRINATMI